MSADSVRTSRRAITVALIWGLAEALVFFVVPDVYLTRLTLQRARVAVAAAIAALVGALLGGTLLWALASAGHAPRLLHAYYWLPGMNHRVITGTAQAIDAHGAAAIYGGMLTHGQPYKLFAVHAGAQAVPFGAFLAASAVAYVVRFGVTIAIAWGMGLLLRSVPLRSRLRLHLLVWSLLYLGFFTLFR